MIPSCLHKSKHAVGAVLNQENRDGCHPVANLSSTMTSAERKYSIQVQQLLALIYAWKNWRHCLFEMEITAYSDHFSLATWKPTENFLEGLLSTMYWYSVDPRSKLLYFIREGERRLRIPRNPELIKMIMHELHDVA